MDVVLDTVSAWYKYTKRFSYYIKITICWCFCMVLIYLEKIIERVGNILNFDEMHRFFFEHIRSDI